MNKKLVLSLLAIVISAATVVTGIQTSKSINNETTQEMSTTVSEAAGITTAVSDSSSVPPSEPGEAAASVEGVGKSSPAPSKKEVPENRISAEEAVEIALNAAGLSASEVYDKETELDYEKGVWVYEVSFDKDRTDYEYVIDAVSGEVLRSKVDPEGKGNSKTDAGTNESNNKPVAEPETSSPAPSKNEVPENRISSEEAVAIALNAAGLSASEIYDKETELDYEKGVWIYEVSFDKDRTDYEYVIDAVSGEVLRSKVDPEGKGNSKSDAGENESNNKPVAEPETSSPAPSKNEVPENKITAKEAEAIALNKAGLSASEIYDKETELDYEKGVWVYEVSFEKGRTEYEYVIDAVSGEILRAKSDID